MTSSHPRCKPISILIGELNRQLKGCANYFSIGYPTGVYREIDWFVRGRLIRHLQRRNQRPYHRPKGEAWYTHLQRLGEVGVGVFGSPAESDQRIYFQSPWRVNAAQCNTGSTNAGLRSAQRRG